jgi:hypothetical protein
MEDLTSREEKNPRETTAREFENASAAAAAAVAAAAAASGVGGGGGGAGTERAMEDLTSREEKNPRETTAREFDNASAAAAADATAGDDGADAAEAARAAEAMSTSPKAGMVES